MSGMNDVICSSIVKVGIETTENTTRSLRELGIAFKNSENISEFFSKEKLTEKFVLLRKFEIFIFEDVTFESHVKENIILEYSMITTDPKNSVINIKSEGKEIWFEFKSVEEFKKWSKAMSPDPLKHLTEKEKIKSFCTKKETASSNGILNLIAIGNHLSNKLTTKENHLKFSGGYRIIKQGNLLKDNHQTSWNERYFILNDNKELRYFLDDSNPNIKGFLSVENSYVWREDKKIFIELIWRTYCLYFPKSDNEEVGEWIDLLVSKGGAILKKDKKSGILKEGNLNKESPSTGIFQTRFFILYGNGIMKYYKNETQKGFIDLQSSIVQRCENKEKELEDCFKIFTKSRIFYLQGSDYNDVTNWMNQLEVAGSKIANIHETVNFQFEKNIMNETLDDDDRKLTMEEKRSKRRSVSIDVGIEIGNKLMHNKRKIQNKSFSLIMSHLNTFENGKTFPSGL
eukprot:gene5021-8619_t